MYILKLFIILWKYNLNLYGNFENNWGICKNFFFGYWGVCRFLGYNIDVWCDDFVKDSMVFFKFSSE